MVWKLIFLTGVFVVGLVAFGYRPDDFRRAAQSVSQASADSFSPRERGGDWGS
ncbi:hypothetical protein [Tsuneonella troitsensis]|jgi:hypothetical protein|uniref:hypothetical protein n=1 Tax=Tsuneonella troitsensis TaxID=292222 RepID=UPI000AC02588|nr:hypothetical protein [Tsuneonella troitsensis]